MQQASSQDTQSDPSGELRPLTARSKPPTGLRGATLAKAGSTLSAHTSLGGDGSSGEGGRGGVLGAGWRRGFKRQQLVPARQAVNPP